MKSFVYGFFGLAILLVLQSTLLHLIPFPSFRPDLVLVGLSLLALRNGPIKGVFLGFLIGLIADIYAVETMGTRAFTFTLSGYIVGLFDETRFSFRIMTKLLILSLLTIWHDSLLLLVQGTNLATIFQGILVRSLPIGLLNALLSYPVFAFQQARSQDL